jgi:hypothetical protein
VERVFPDTPLQSESARTCSVGNLKNAKGEMEMELFNLIAAWAGWPIIVAVLLIGGGYAGWLQRNRIEQLKEQIEALRLQTKPKESLPTGIKITSPRSGDAVDKWFTVSGVFKNRPANARLQLAVISGSGALWPQGIATFDDENKTWNAQVHIGGNPGNEAIVVATVVGGEGQALFDYYSKVGKETNEWPPIDKLTSDVTEVDRMKVFLK